MRGAGNQCGPILPWQHSTLFSFHQYNFYLSTYFKLPQ